MYMMLQHNIICYDMIYTSHSCPPASGAAVIATAPSNNNNNVNININNNNNVNENDK